MELSALASVITAIAALLSVLVSMVSIGVSIWAAKRSNAAFRKVIAIQNLGGMFGPGHMGPVNYY